MYSIVMGFRDNYKEYGYTTIYSLLENNQGYFFSIYILSDNLDFDYFKGLEQQFSCEIIPISVTVSDIKNIDCGYLTFGTLIRLLIGQYIPKDIDSILYLDADLIINDDIHELMSTELDEYYAAVVKSNVSKKHLKALRVHSEHYFNAGVILFNLRTCRKDIIFQRAIELLHKKKFKYLDQDVLNIILENNVKYIDSKWNFDSFRAKSLVLNGRLKEKKSGAIIYHYTGLDKPWNMLCQNPFKNVYRKYYCYRLKYNLVNNATLIYRIKLKLTGVLYKCPVTRGVINFVRNCIRSNID